MTIERFIDIYVMSKPVNYGVQFIDEQLRILTELHADRLHCSKDEMMYLNIISSALKYYINTSVEGYSEDIFKIVDMISVLYNFEDLLVRILETESESN